MKDPYRILGVSTGASDLEIGKAFKREARRSHPDVHPNDPQAEDRFKAISEAYALLSDPVKRRLHDEAHQRAQSPSRESSSAYSPPMSSAKKTSAHDLGDVFDDLFKDATQARASGVDSAAPDGDPLREAAHDALLVLSIPFKEAVFGAEHRLRLPNGCEVKLVVPAGTAHRDVIRVPQKKIVQGASRGIGDCYVEIDLLPHPRFERRLDDLVSHVSVPLATALFGGRVDFVLLDETRVPLKILAGTQSGTEIKLTGQGAFNQKKRARGDLFIRVEVRYPTRLHPADRETMKLILERSEEM